MKIKRMFLVVIIFLFLSSSILVEGVSISTDVGSTLSGAVNISLESKSEDQNRGLAFGISFLSQQYDTVKMNGYGVSLTPKFYLNNSNLYSFIGFGVGGISLVDSYYGSSGMIMMYSISGGIGYKFIIPTSDVIFFVEPYLGVAYINISNVISGISPAFDLGIGLIF
ncbi:hypothetical protein [Marinitoga sp. 1138]|uniref:hypothetical protein n=1 Tax=Marinitoga sp. 1138 TaxID=1643334 RepID=UPI0015863B45|nr:hypothetical protein [Marinitoga sp. 1138]NUU96795.1 hypothetical protein [Marinitoga sp. 1138]